MNRDVIGQCDMIIIAVKPYQVLEVMQEIHQIFKTSGSHPPKSLRPLVVSVAASVPLAEIEKKVSVHWWFLGTLHGRGHSMWADKTRLKHGSYLRVGI